MSDEKSQPLLDRMLYPATREEYFIAVRKAIKTGLIVLGVWALIALLEKIL